MEGVFFVFIVVILVGLLFLLSLGLLFTAIGICLFNYKTAIWRNLNALVLISLVLGMVFGLMAGYCYQIDLMQRKEHPITL